MLTGSTGLTHRSQQGVSWNILPLVGHNFLDFITLSECLWKHQIIFFLLFTFEIPKLWCFLAQFFADKAALCTNFSTWWELNIPFRGGNWILNSARYLSERACTRASCHFATFCLCNNVKDLRLRKSAEALQKSFGKPLRGFHCAQQLLFMVEYLKRSNKSYSWGDVLIPDLTKCEIAFAK